MRQSGSSEDEDSEADDDVDDHEAPDMSCGLREQLKAGSWAARGQPTLWVCLGRAFVVMRTCVRKMRA